MATVNPERRELMGQRVCHFKNRFIGLEDIRLP